MVLKNQSLNPIVLDALKEAKQKKAASNVTEVADAKKQEDKNEVVGEEFWKQHDVQIIRKQI